MRVWYCISQLPSMTRRTQFWCDLRLWCAFWENPKTNLWSQIIWILLYQNNGRSEKGSFTMTKACPCAPRDEKKRKKETNKLILAAKTRRNRNYVYEYTKYIFRFETQSSLEAYISHECLPVGHSEYIHIEDITWTCEHTKFIFECHVWIQE